MNEVLQLKNEAAERSSAPAGGSDAALGDAFNTRGTSNADLAHGDVVKYRDVASFHTAQVAGVAQMPGTYDILLHERQVPMASIVAKPGETVRPGARVMYSKNCFLDQAIVEKVSYEVSPPVVTIRIIRRNVERSRLMKIK